MLYVIRAVVEILNYQNLFFSFKIASTNLKVLECLKWTRRAFKKAIKRVSLVSTFRMSFLRSVCGGKVYYIHFQIDIAWYKKNTETVISILFVAKSDENAFQSRTKPFFWARVGTIGFGLKLERSESFNEANRTHSRPEKLLCSRLKSILITFRYKQYRT